MTDGNNVTDFEFDSDPADHAARYHGGYECPECNHLTNATARPKPGCRGGRCTDCGTPTEWVDVIRRTGAPDDPHGFGPRRLTEDEVRRGYDLLIADDSEVGNND